MVIKKYYSTSEAGKILGISREAVLKQINTGRLKAERVGRSFVIPLEALPLKHLPVQEQNEIKEAVERVIREYGWVLKKLGQE